MQEEITWRINEAYFDKLAREHYGEFRYIGFDELVCFLNVWASKNNCSRHGIASMISSEEDYLMFKLQGIALTTQVNWAMEKLQYRT